MSTAAIETKVYYCEDCSYEVKDCRCSCFTCGGDGGFYGKDNPDFDPMWNMLDEWEVCGNCGGSGLRRDQTSW